MRSGLRVLKRFLLLFIFLGLIGAAVVAGVQILADPLPTPTPDPRNQLRPLEVLSVELLRIQEQDYDVLARVRNPNQTYGSGKVQYTLDLFYDSTGGGEARQQHSGSFYILPGQTKYVVVTPLRSVYRITRATMAITSVDWQELDTLALQGINFVVTNALYDTKPRPDTFGRIRGFVANNSDFDVNRVDVAVILFDERERPLAVNRTEIHTFLAHTTRGFETSWFVPFDGKVARTHIEAHANLFEQSTFIRTYGGKELFQTY